MQVSEVARQLKRLRERAGYGLREFAAQIELSASAYQYYEARFKKAYLPKEFVEKLAPKLVGRGLPLITTDEIVTLYGGVPSVRSVSSQDREATDVDEALDAPSVGKIRSSMPRDVPVLGTATGGSDADFTIINGDAVDWVRRPPRLRGRKDIFALWVRSNSMARWRSEGDLVYCEGARAPRNGDFVIIQMKPNGIDDDRPAFLKRLVSQGGNDYTVEQFNPAKTFKIPKKHVDAMFRVIDWAELLSV